MEPPEPRAEHAPVSERSRAVALGLALVGGPFGLHRFYTGRIQSGIWMCLTLGGMGISYLYDVVAGAAVMSRASAGRRPAVRGVARSPAAPLATCMGGAVRSRRL